MGARIGLTSEVGKGTTAFLEVSFEIGTSICLPPLNIQTPQPFLPPTLKQSKLHSLVVEDNAINQKMVCAMLKKLGYDVSVAENGQVAVDTVLREFYNIILMDVQMPVMDGIEATKKIRGMKSKQFKDLTIIGLTAAYESSDLDYYTGIGMDTCIGKPVRLDGLKKAINATLCTTSPQSNQ
jgi:CheY-like chemotaxis protein